MLQPYVRQHILTIVIFVRRFSLIYVLYGPQCNTIGPIRTVELCNKHMREIYCITDTVWGELSWTSSKL